MTNEEEAFFRPRRGGLHFLDVVYFANREFLMLISVLTIFKRLSFKQWLGLLAALIVAVAVGWLVLELRAGAAAQDKVEVLERENKQLENTVEALDGLTQDLDAAREEDVQVREVIRKVPVRELSEPEQEAWETLFK